MTHAETDGFLKRPLEAGRFDGGIAMQLADYEGFTVNVWEYLLGNGIDVESGTGMIDFGGRDAHGLLDDLAGDLHDEVRPGKSVILPGALQHNEDESLGVPGRADPVPAPLAAGDPDAGAVRSVRDRGPGGRVVRGRRGADAGRARRREPRGERVFEAPEADAMYEALTGEGPGQRPEVQRYTHFSRAFREFLHGEIMESPDPGLDPLESTLNNALSGR